MARVNVGIDPIYLADQHLIAESVEITMITGQLQKHNWQIKSEIPDEFVLGKGHMTFFKNKLPYLEARLNSVNSEMRKRDFSPGTDLTELVASAEPKFCTGWLPNLTDSKAVRTRIASRLLTRRGGRPGAGYYRYRGQVMNEDRLLEFINEMMKSELFNV